MSFYDGFPTDIKEEIKEGMPYSRQTEVVKGQSRDEYVETERSYVKRKRIVNVEDIGTQTDEEEEEEVEKVKVKRKDKV